MEKQWADSLNSFLYGIEMLIAAAIYFGYLNKRKKFLLRLAAGVGVLMLCAAFIHPFFNDVTKWYNWFWFLGVYILIILIVYGCCDISFADAVYAASCGYITEHLASTLYILIFSKGSRMPSFTGFWFFAVYALVYAGAFFLLAKRMPDSGAYHIGRANALVVAAAVLIITLVLSLMVKSTTADVSATAVVTENYTRLFLYTQFYALSACVLFLAMQVIQRREIRTVRKLEQNQNLWKQRQLQYEMSRENIDLINRKCHDLKHQIAALAQTDGRDQKRQEFAAEIQDMVEVYDAGAGTGNEALDTILMEKSLYCRLHGIEWLQMADGRLLEYIDVVDLYTMMGNALDNAVEAVEKCADGVWRSISVKIWRQELFAVIRIENSCSQVPEFRDGIPVSTKGDADNHGYGVRSIRLIAEKYQGTVSVKVEDGVFLLTILLPLGAESAVQ